MFLECFFLPIGFLPLSAEGGRGRGNYYVHTYLIKKGRGGKQAGDRRGGEPHRKFGFNTTMYVLHTNLPLYTTTYRHRMVADFVFSHLLLFIAKLLSRCVPLHAACLLAS